MDDRLQKALDQANYNLTIQTQKKNLQFRFQNAITYSVHGGTFTVTPQLIAFVDALSRNEITDSVIIDDRGNPIMIPDVADFLETIISTYQEATNEFYAEMTKLRKARTTKASVGL